MRVEMETGGVGGGDDIQMNTKHAWGGEDFEGDGGRDFAEFDEIGNADEAGTDTSTVTHSVHLPEPFDTLVQRAKTLVEQQNGVDAFDTEATQTLSKDMWQRVSKDLPGHALLSKLKPVANNDLLRDLGYSEPKLNVLLQGQDYMASADRIKQSHQVSKLNFERLVEQVQLHRDMVTSNPDLLDSPAQITAGIQLAHTLSDAQVDVTCTSSNMLGVSRPLTAGQGAVLQQVRDVSWLVALFAQPGMELGYQPANRGFHMPADELGLVCTILGAYRPNSEAYSSKRAGRSTCESGACMVIQKGVMLDSSDPDIIKRLQLLFLDGFLDGVVWQEVTAADGSKTKVQISIDERIARTDPFAFAGLVLTWGYAAETAIASINAARAKAGLPAMSNYALIWGHAPWGWQQTYSELAATYLPRMPRYFTGLKSPHSMAFFYPFRMADITPEFRLIAATSLHIMCKSLGLTPSAVWAPFTGALETLQKLRKLLRSHKVRPLPFSRHTSILLPCKRAC